MKKLKISGFRRTRGLVTALIVFINCACSMSQEVYDNFEGNSNVIYDLKKAGKMDSAAANPKPDNTNDSRGCAKYTRSRQRFDNIKMNLKGTLGEVGAYSTYSGTPKKLKLKVVPAVRKA